MMRRILTVILVLAVLLLGGNCVGASNVVRIAYSDIDNFVGVKDGRLEGYGVALFDAIADHTGWTYEYKRGSWEQCLEWVKNGEADFTFPAQYSEKRAEEFLFSQQNCILDFAAIYTASTNSDILYQDYGSLQGKRLGMIRGNYLNLCFDQFVGAQGINVQKLYYSSGAEVNEALASGRIDAIMSGNCVFDRDKKLVAKFDYLPAYIIAGKNNTALMQQLDQAMRAMTLENPYFTAELYETFYGRANRLAKGLTRAELAYSQTAAPLRVVGDGDHYPLEWLDNKSGGYKGAYQDVLKLLAQDSGLTMEMTYTPDMAASWELLAAGKADIISGIVWTKELEEKYDFLHTDSFFKENYLILGRRGQSFDFNSDLKVAMRSSFIGAGDYIRQKYPQWQIMYGDTMEACLDMVVNGEADIMLGNSIVLTTNRYLTKYAGLTPVLTMSLEIPVGFGVSKKCPPEVLSILNKSIQKLDAGVLDKIILDNSIVKRRPLDWQEFIKNNFLAAGTVFFVVLALLFTGVFLFLKNRQQARFNNSLAAALAEAERDRSAAEYAHNVKSEFLSRMSHEIRTPINAIIGMSDITKLRAADCPAVLDCLGKLDVAARHLAALVDDVLDMSKIENAKLQLAPQVVSLHSIITSALNILQPLAEAKGVLLQSQTGIADCRVYADSKRLLQILVNLGANAVKFTDRDKKVFLKCEVLEQDQAGLLVRFVAEDEGLGIEESNRQCIFEAFNQGGRSTDAVYGGTGLGLAISQKLAQMMGSEIKLSSTVGVGSRFWFDLHLPRAANAQEEAPAADRIDLHGYRLMVVEDNEINMEIVCELLRNAGAEFAVASDGAAAVALFCEAEPFAYDAVLMDIRMPKMNGYQATAAIRALPRPDAGSVVIIAMTADVLADDVERALEQGMNAHIAKPLDTRRFLLLLQRLLRNKENMICK